MPYWISILVALLAFVISSALGIVLIPFLKKLHFGQTILDIGPKWHMSKQGTPIMGGFMFIIGSIVACAVGFLIYSSNFVDITSAETQNRMLRLVATIVYALLVSAIGFSDDYIKAVKKQNLGLSALQKLAFQLLLAGGLLGVLYALGDKGTSINLYFTQLDLKFFYYPFMMFLMVGFNNAVNLTDGVDGLCGTVTVVSMLCLNAICSVLGLNEQSIFAVALAGGCLGFLVWNMHPAKVFMGDTGSMFLGGAFVAIGVATGHIIPMILVGFIYLVETMSVVLQVISFKTTGKRIFKMSPIHHHFEMSGYSEYKIVVTFSLVGVIAGALAVAIVLLTSGNVY